MNISKMRQSAIRKLENKSDSLICFLIFFGQIKIPKNP